MKTKQKAIGVICGGVISESELKKHDILEIMMCYILPDDKFEEYMKLKKERENIKKQLNYLGNMPIA